MAAVGRRGRQVRSAQCRALDGAEPQAFTADDRAIADLLASHASVAVDTALHSATFAEAVNARKLVGQAMGILMERFDVDDDRTFSFLRRYSQDTNTLLREVAQQLIDSRRLPVDRTAGQDQQPSGRRVGRRILVNGALDSEAAQ